MGIRSIWRGNEQIARHRSTSLRLGWVDFKIVNIAPESCLWCMLTRG